MLCYPHQRVRTIRNLLAVLVFALFGCSPEAGTDGSQILVPYPALSGGMLFATQAIEGNNGYDLFWAPVPMQQTIEPQLIARVTHASGNEWQPSVSRGGNGIVFARENDGIYLISTSGRVSRVSSADGSRFADSIPAISTDGAQVAWVRADKSKPSGSFFESAVWVASFDGRNAHAVNPRAGVVQDAPAFDPADTSKSLAWTEFSLSSIGPAGPVHFGIWIQDLADETGHYACQDGAYSIGGRATPFRCFGEFLAWPLPNVLVTGQDLLEIHLDGSPQTIWNSLIGSILSEQNGTPQVGDPGNGFFPQFPLSVSYSKNVDRLVIDGPVVNIDGTVPTESFWIAGSDGSGPWRLPLAGYSGDFDQSHTSNYFFSVATPQLVP
jgi:hypothetical protein